MTTKLERATANEYPIRYTAYDRPGVLIVNPRPFKRGGNEWAHLSLTMPNREFPELTDGVSISICSYQCIDLLLECHATAPTASRPRRDLQYRADYKDFESMLLRAEIWYRETLEWLRTTTL